MTVLIDPYLFAPAGATDPNFASVVLLLHFDGANGARTFPDNSLAAHSVTSTGGSAWQLTTAQQKFGVSSLQCGTTGWASSADSADWSLRRAIHRRVLDQTNGDDFRRARDRDAVRRQLDYGWFFGFNGNTLNFFYSTTGTDNPAVTGAYTPTQNVWTTSRPTGMRAMCCGSTRTALCSRHPRCRRRFSTAPERCGSATTTSRGSLPARSRMRITKGFARYGGAFTPPTAPFPDAWAIT